MPRIDDPAFEEAISESLNRSKQTLRAFTYIQACRCPHHHHQGQHFFGTQGIEITVKKIAGGLNDAPASAGVWNLIDVKLEYVAFGKYFFKMDGFNTFQPAGPEGTRPRMPHTDYLFAEGAGTPHRPQRSDILNHRMHPRRPVNALVAVKPLILGYHQGLLQKLRNIMQGNLSMNIPPVLVSNGQRHVIAVQHLSLAHA